MKIVKFVDIYITKYDEEGKSYDKIEKANVGIPEYINEKKVTNISPYFASTGRLFKNVSIIVYEGNQIKVVGNYNDLHKIIKNQTNPVKGFVQKRGNESTKS